MADRKIQDVATVEKGTLFAWRGDELQYIDPDLIKWDFDNSLLVLNDALYPANFATGSEDIAATSGAVVVGLTKLRSTYTTNATADIAATLADGYRGQIKIVKLKTKDTSDMVLTPANFGDGTTITFDATGEVAVLMFDGSNWWVIYTTATVA